MASPAAAPQRRLYIYYRVPESALAATLDAVRAVQADLLAAHAGLATELLRRPEAGNGEVTLMEAYGGGLDEARLAAIAAATSALPQPRHHELFDIL